MNIKTCVELLSEYSDFKLFWMMYKQTPYYERIERNAYHELADDHHGKIYEIIEREIPEARENFEISKSIFEFLRCLDRISNKRPHAVQRILALYTFVETLQ